MAEPTVYQQQVGFAPAIEPFALSNLEAAKKAVATPYQSYADWAKSQGLTGDQVASFTDLQKQAFGQAGNLGQDPNSLAAAQGLQSLSGQQFGQQQADQYMSPYIQSVIQNQQRDAARQSAIQGTQQQAQAAQSGAFGGSRDAIMRAERERNLALQQGDIQAAGLQNAYTNAQNQFNADTSRGLQGFAALGSQGQNLYGQTTGNMNLQNAMGTQQQQQVQNLLNVGQQNYTAEQNYPYKQIGFMSDIVRGAPLSNQGTNVYTPPPSALGQVATLGAAAKGFGFANGGAVQAKKPAGLAALLIHGMK
jgi:hypothetical protein